jgi:hypothetical protein
MARLTNGNNLERARAGFFHHKLDVNWNSSILEAFFAEKKLSNFQYVFN